MDCGRCSMERKKYEIDILLSADVYDVKIYSYIVTRSGLIFKTSLFYSITKCLCASV